MRFVSSLAVLLLASASLSAQSNSGSSGTVWTAPPQSIGCPIDFTAKRQQGLVVRSVNDGHGDATGQGLRFTFRAPTALKIMKVNLIVHGPSLQARAVPAASNSEVNADVPEIFHLERRAGASTLQTSEIWTKIGAVRLVEVTEIQFVNGVLWRESETSKCRTEPGNLLLTNLEASEGSVAK
jgi:hypothetical protein